ncbi:Cutinase [Mycena kentingensis (nom. inval.)]|nr:Cutinase [Mycena kentingensis (nom. inval.)]
MQMLRAVVALLALPFFALGAPVAERQACSDVIVVFARGTTEPGTIGTVVGPPLLAALQMALAGKSVTMTGVPYAADVGGFLEGGDPAGSATMASLLTSAANRCPNVLGARHVWLLARRQVSFQCILHPTVLTKAIGQLVHNSVKLISSSVASHIKAAVIFGDPDKGQPLQGIPAGNTLTICHATDLICAGQAVILPSHLTYGADTPQAAAFIANHV